MKPFKPMLLTLVAHWPIGEDWVYEVKYDGYRGQLAIDESKIELTSRNLKSLSEAFPEIIKEVESLGELRGHAPLILDGEVCLLKSDLAANFDQIQQRGRLKKSEKIRQYREASPATFVAFDLLMYDGQSLLNQPLSKRKELLRQLITRTVCYASENQIQRVEVYQEPEALWERVQEKGGEGIVAKKLSSRYDPGKRTTQWVKIKNNQSGVFFITAYDKENGYFEVSLIKDGELHPVGVFSHGLSVQERETLLAVIKKNKATETSKLITIDPSICVELEYLEWYKDELRHPRFSSFKLDWNWEDCTWEAMRVNK